jgi:hypothetical protein
MTGRETPGFGRFTGGHIVFVAVAAHMMVEARRRHKAAASEPVSK